MSKKKRTRRYQHGSLCESPDGKRWIVKYYYAPGKQTTKSLGPKSKISRRQAEMMRDDLVRPLNQNPFATLERRRSERYVEDVFFPMKSDKTGGRTLPRRACGKFESISCLNSVTPLRRKSQRHSLRATSEEKGGTRSREGERKSLAVLLTDICRSATAEGYLQIQRQ